MIAGLFCWGLPAPKNMYIMEILQAVGESQDLLALFFPLILTLVLEHRKGYTSRKLSVPCYYINYIHKLRLFT